MGGIAARQATLGAGTACLGQATILGSAQEDRFDGHGV
jgi:hypothetical protein